jgi:hypothetical protein
MYPIMEHTVPKSSRRHQLAIKDEEHQEDPCIGKWVAVWVFGISAMTLVSRYQLAAEHASEKEASCPREPRMADTRNSAYKS